jgi:hypothetical protein
MAEILVFPICKTGILLSGNITEVTGSRSNVAGFKENIECTTYIPGICV